MNTITYKMQFTFSKSSVLGFAKFLGYKEIIRKEDSNVAIGFSEIANPENAFDFIARLARIHNEKFVTQWANFLVAQQVKTQSDILQDELKTEVVKPVIDAIQVNYE